AGWRSGPCRCFRSGRAGGRSIRPGPQRPDRGEPGPGDARLGTREPPAARGLAVRAEVGTPSPLHDALYGRPAGPAGLPRAVVDEKDVFATLLDVGDRLWTVLVAQGRIERFLDRGGETPDLVVVDGSPDPVRVQ